jgi:alkylhydroperoxidase family enzyme
MNVNVCHRIMVVTTAAFLSVDGAHTAAPAEARRANADVQGAFTRPVTPRIQPLSGSAWTETHRDALGPFGKSGQSSPFFMTCLRNVELCRSWIPLTQYLGLASTLPRRDKEMLLLRTAVLCQDDFVWSEHAQGPSRRVLGDDEIARIAEGPNAMGWSATDAALLRANDQLYSEHFIDDETWRALAERYTEPQLIDLIFTVGHYVTTSMFVNSVGLTMAPDFRGRPRSAVRITHAERPYLPLRAPRIRPLERSQWTDAHRSAIGPYTIEGKPIGVFHISVKNPELTTAWAPFIRYVEGPATTLPHHDLDVLMPRTGALTHSDYVWGKRADGASRAGMSLAQIAAMRKGSGATGWSPWERALMRAVEELLTNQFITDMTWHALAQQYSDAQMLDAILVVGQDTMLAMFANSVGVPVEQGWSRLRR